MEGGVFAACVVGNNNQVEFEEEKLD